MIKEAISKRIKTISFGTSSSTDESLLMYKKHWGCIQKPIYYHYWNKEPKMLDIESSYTNLRNIFQIIPIPVFKKISEKMIPRLI